MSRIKTAKFVEPNDPVLTRVAEEVYLPELFSEEISDYIDTMFYMARENQSNRGERVLVGLAAPQIGISKRIILVDVIADGEGEVGDLRLYINPKITWRSEEESEWYEGCFSTSCVCGVFLRPTTIRVKALKIDWKKKTMETSEEEEYSGYVARIFQHKIDHLDRKEFTTHVTDPEKLHWVEKDEFFEYRDKQGWKNWPNKCSLDDWEKIKLFGLLARKVIARE